VPCLFAYGFAAIFLDARLRARKNVLLSRLSAAGLLAFFLSFPEILNSYGYAKTQNTESQHSLVPSVTTAVALTRRWGAGFPAGMVYVFLALLALGIAYSLVSRGPRSFFLVVWLVSAPLFFAVLPFDKFFDIRFLVPSYPVFLLLVAGGIEGLVAARTRHPVLGPLLAVAVTGRRKQPAW
jgi:hypothetical protein